MIQFNTAHQVEDYLKDNLYSTNFLNNHVRPDFVNMLNILYKNTNFGRGMCKTRQVEHLKFWMKLHNIKCKGE